MAYEIKFPDSDKWYVRWLRFANMLDDEKNILSPVKLNVWAANVGTFSTFVATVFAWSGSHIQGIEALWGGAMTWLTHAHTVHHFDKRERNVEKVRMAKVSQGGDPKV